MSVTLKSRKRDKLLKYVKELPAVLKETFMQFLTENGFFHGAALAYYTLFAMVPLFYLLIVYISKILGKKLILSVIADILQNKVGISDIAGVMDFMNQFDFEKGNFILEVASIVALMVACSAFVVSLKQSINEFFDVTLAFKSKKRQIVKGLLFRLFSLLLILILTIVVVLVYLVQTFVLSINDSLFSDVAFLQLFLSSIAKHGFAIFSNMVIFSLILKYVHDGVVSWKLAIAGALFTSILLYSGQLIIKYYLFHYFFAASGGIAGSLFIILAWVYYSSQIIFFGAKFTAVLAKHTGSPIVFKG